MIPNGNSTEKYRKYAITISPPNRVRYTKDTNPNKNLFMEDKLIIKQIFNYIKCGTYLIYPEFDEKGRLHYHGTIDLDYNQYVRFMKYAQFKLPKLGFMDLKKIDTFQDNIKWNIYMSKEWGTTREILEISRPIMKYPTELYNNKNQNSGNKSENVGNKFFGDIISKKNLWGDEPLPLSDI